jgi:hypothetical protein
VRYVIYIYVVSRLRVKLILELSAKLHVLGSVMLGRMSLVSTTTLFQKFVVKPWHVATDTGNGTLYCDAVALTVGNGETKLFVRFFIFGQTVDSE